jgi:RimJ/RimL family protein N-acetyltransferase
LAATATGWQWRYGVNTIWTGERVRLRPFKDKDEFVGLNHELHVAPNQFWGAWWSTRRELEEDYDKGGMLSTEKDSAFAIERLDTGQLVGYEGYVFVSNIFAWVGTFIRPEHWHRGFGIEAKQLCYCFLFENFPIERVDAGTLEHHLRAINGLLRSGMKFEGRVKSVGYTHGQYYDEMIYTIFREQWARLPIRQVVKRGA